MNLVRVGLACSVPYLSVGFSRRFDRIPAILVCKSEHTHGKRAETTEGGLVRVRLDTLPRLCSPLQTKMLAARSKGTSLKNLTEKIGGCEHSNVVCRCCVVVVVAIEILFLTGIGVTSCTRGAGSVYQSVHLR